MLSSPESDTEGSIGSKGSPENIAFLEDQLLHALKILKEEKRSLAKNVPAIAAARGETISEPTAQRAALDEEEQKRRRDLAEAVDAPQAKKAKKQKKRRIPREISARHPAAAFSKAAALRRPRWSKRLEPTLVCLRCPV